MRFSWALRSALVSVLGLRIVAGCSSDSAPLAARDAQVEVVADAAPDQRTPYVPADPPRPEGLPDGWELERSFDKLCGLYVPQSRDLLPGPVRWEPCPPIVKPAGASCQVMANDEGESSHPGADAAWVAPDGKVVLSVWRTAQPMGKGAHWIIADADGPVHTAMFLAPTSRCSPAFPSLLGGRYAVGVIVDSSPYGGGFFAGAIDDLSPRIAVHLTKQDAHSIKAGPFSIVDLNKGFQLEQYSWADGSPLPLLWSPAQDHGLQQGDFAFADDAMFWVADNLDYAKINVYTPATGVRDFLSAGLVIDHGYGAIGTDGRDLVWIEAKGRATGGSTPFDTYDIMIAPYTVDPAMVVARRLRSEDGPVYTIMNYVVGCGYSARSNGYRIRITRLSDGWSWTLPQPTVGSPASERDWAWMDPLAITCTELFLPVSINKETSPHFARLRLDSLGPGVAPD